MRLDRAEKIRKAGEREQPVQESELKRLKEQTDEMLMVLKMPGPLAEAYGGGLRAGDPARA